MGRDTCCHNTILPRQDRTKENEKSWGFNNMTLQSYDLAYLIICAVGMSAAATVGVLYVTFNKARSIGWTEGYFYRENIEKIKRDAATGKFKKVTT